MVYSFFDPDLARDSLGSFIILDHVAIAREAALPYVYLGYWVPGSAKMDYKARFQPLEIFAEGRWSLLSATDTAARGAPARRPPGDQRAGRRDRAARPPSSRRHPHRSRAAPDVAQPLVRLRIMKLS